MVHQLKPVFQHHSNLMREVHRILTNSPKTILSRELQKIMEVTKKQIINLTFIKTVSGRAVRELVMRPPEKRLVGIHLMTSLFLWRMPTRIVPIGPYTSCTNRCQARVSRAVSGRGKKKPRHGVSRANRRKTRD